LKAHEENFVALSNLTDCSRCLGKFAFNLITCVINLVKAWLCVNSRHTCDHRVNASIKIMKYLNSHDNGCIGQQISP
jgi:hypothetical protein